MSPRCIHFILKLKKCQCGHPLSLFTASHQAFTQCAHPLSLFTASHQAFTQCAHPLSQLTLASVTASHQCGHPLSLFTTSHQAFTEYGHPFSLFTASHQVEAQSPPWDHLPFCQKPKTGRDRDPFMWTSLDIESNLPHSLIGLSESDGCTEAVPINFFLYHVSLVK